MWVFILTGLGLNTSTARTAEPGAYGPQFEETGPQSGSRMHVHSPQVSVNRFGGNLVVTESDIDIPSTGGFGLFFHRAHNSGGAYDPLEGHLTVHRQNDSPLGLGWSSHYGYLRYATGRRPEFATSAGGRQVFYRNDVIGELDFGSSVRSWVNASLDVLIQDTRDGSFRLKTTSGLTYELQFAGNARYVPVRITDQGGNAWTIQYAANWITEYPWHPVIEQVTDDLGRALVFTYKTVAQAPRIDTVRLNRTTLASYSYDSDGYNVYLREHKTPEGRRTTYTYYRRSEPRKNGALKTITLDTGGTWSMQYAEKKFHYKVGYNLPSVLSLTRLSRQGSDGTDVWEYTYPNRGGAGEYSVGISGPDGYSATYTYHGYYGSTCSGQDLWKVGRLKSSSESYNGTTRRRSVALGASPLKISEEPVWSDCGPQRAYAIRPSGETVVRDGRSLTTTYQSYDLIFPGRIVRPGSVVETRSYKHIVGARTYVLALPVNVATSVQGTLASKTAYSGYSAKGFPSRVAMYRTARSPISVRLEYDVWGRGTKGVVTKKAYGIYSETYSYENGVLAGVAYAAGPRLSRSVATNGTVSSERVNGVMRTLSYDRDLRLTRVQSPLDAAVSIAYGTNTRTITQGKSVIAETCDDWGRRERLSKTVDGKTSETFWGYDAFERVSKATSPRKLTTTTRYDVEGRPLAQTSSLLELDFDYDTTSTYSRVTTTKNGTVKTVLDTDHAGRVVRAELNGHVVTFAYSGTKQTITHNGQSREITYDFFGQKTREEHPEYYNDAIVYGYDRHGWLQTVTKPMGGIRYDRDARGRITRVKELGGSSLVSYEYHRTYGALVKATRGLVTTEALSAYFDSEGRPRRFRTTVPRHAPPPAVAAAREVVGGTPAPLGAATPWARYPSEWHMKPTLRAEAFAQYETDYLWSQRPPETVVRWSWTPIPDAAEYELELSPIGDTNSEPHRATTTQTQATTSTFGSLPDAAETYELRVRALDPDGIPGLWSLWRHAGNSSGTTRCPDASASRGDVVLEGDVAYDTLGRIASVKHPGVVGSAVNQVYGYAVNAGVESVTYGGSSVITGGDFAVDGVLQGFTFARLHGFPGGAVRRTHDSLGRLHTASATVNRRSVYEVADTQYNDWGFVRTVSRRDFLRGSFDYGYTTRGELSRWGVALSEGSGGVRYSYDTHANLTGHTGLDVGTLFLAASDDVSFDSYNHHPEKRYDSNGRVTQAGGLVHSYDGLERLGVLRRSDSDSVVAQYLYDGNGERVRSVGNTGVVYSYRGSGPTVLTQVEYRADSDGCGETALQRDYVLHDGVPVLVAMRSTDGTVNRQFIIRDRLGNPAVVFDESLGFAEEHHAYSPYGTAILADNASSVTHVFTGHERDEDTGLDYMHARYYGSRGGQFFRPDPGFDFNPSWPASYNLYAYSLNAPVNFTDPTGMFVCGGLCLAGAVAAGGAISGGVGGWIASDGDGLSTVVGTVVGAAIGLANLLVPGSAGVLATTGTAMLASGTASVGGQAVGNVLTGNDVLDATNYDGWAVAGAAVGGGATGAVAARSGFKMAEGIARTAGRSYLTQYETSALRAPVEGVLNGIGAGFGEKLMSDLGASREQFPAPVPSMELVPLVDSSTESVGILSISREDVRIDY
jgi:RHS repeat-associated protein